VATLRRHRSKQLKERLVAGADWKEHGLVFATSVETPLDSRNVTQRLQRLLEDAGLPRIRFHDLRHTAASLLLAQGIHPRVVMEILGHSQFRLTMDTYSHAIPTLERDAAEKMDAILGRDS
jgi:integrase